MVKYLVLLALTGATLSSCTRPEQTTTAPCAEAGATVRTVTMSTKKPLDERGFSIVTLLGPQAALATLAA
jgi:hypothetical protein